jgi:hypothetical protein
MHKAIAYLDIDVQQAAMAGDANVLFKTFLSLPVSPWTPLDFLVSKAV